MLEALLWGFVAASSLLIGAVVGLRVGLSDRLIGLLMGVGAGALIAGVSFELAEEALREGGVVPSGIGLAVGALAFYAGDRALEASDNKRHSGRPRGADAHASGSTLALGALLDGVPEQAAIGIGLAAGGEVGVALVAAVFLSNVPEALASADAMKQAGRPARVTLRLWTGVVLVTTLASGLGYLLLGDASGAVNAGILGVAAGAVLVMLVDAMVPEAVRKGGPTVGLVTCLGFALAVLLSTLG